MLGRLKSLKGKIGWEGPTYQIRNRDGERIDEDKKREEGNRADNSVCLWNLRFLLQRIKSGILGQL